MEPIKRLLTDENPDNLHLCFVLDGNIYALNAKHVLEITTLPLINEPQRMPEYIVGILNYNDLFINVLDIRKILALPQKNFKLTDKVIIIKGDESLIAIIADEVTNFFTATPANVQRIMGETSNNVVKTFYKIKENIINLVDVHTLEEKVKKAHHLTNNTNYSQLFPQDAESVTILQKRRNEIAAIPQMHLDTGVYGKDQYIIFKLGIHTYCVYSLFVKELISPKNYTITPIPYTPDFVKGIINLKGIFYTVIDLRTFIGKQEFDNNQELTEEPKIIVLDVRELKLAFIVDDILDIINIPEEKIEPKNQLELDKLFISAEVYIENNVYNILNVEKLINDEKLYIDNSN